MMDRTRVLPAGSVPAGPRLGVAVVVTAWLLTTAFAFWWFALKDIRPFEIPDGAQAAVFDAAGREAAAEGWFRGVRARHGGSGSPATVVHIAAPDCACSRFTEPHFATIVGKYAAKGVAFVVAEGRVEGLPDAVKARVRTLAGDAAAADLDWVRTGPAALIYDGDGRLVYYGPYSTGALCGTTQGPVERALDRLLAMEPPAPQPVLAVGCYCNRNVERSAARTGKIRG